MPQPTTRYPRASLAACLIPWTPQFDLDVPVFERHIRHILDGGYRHLYLMGTAGEGYALDDALFRQVVEVFASVTGSDPRVGADGQPGAQVGAIGTSMRQMIARIAAAHELGIRMFQISLPCWGALSDRELLTFFKTVCGEFSDSKFLHYNLPRACRVLTGSDYRTIADAVPNLVATKNSNSDYRKTLDLIEKAGDLQHFLLEGNFAMGCTMGECSLLCSPAILFPKTTWSYYEAGLRQDHVQTFRIARFFASLVPILFGHVGRTMIDGGYDKTFCRLACPWFPNRLLPPYEGLTEGEFDVCRRAFETHFLDAEQA